MTMYRPIIPSLLALASLLGAGDADALARDLLARAGINVGLCALPRAGDGALAVALNRAGARMVYGGLADPGGLERARSAVAATGLLGRGVMLDRGLPLATWSADLVVVADATDGDLAGLDPAEIHRVMSPYRGVALIGNPGRGLSRRALSDWAARFGNRASVTADAGGTWARIVRPADPGMDEWTHFWHGGGNNAVSDDAVVKPPYDMQYITTPFTGTGGSSRFAGGRFFEMQGQQHKHGDSRKMLGQIWCRNAYNGQILWQMEFPEHIDAKQLTAVATADAFYLLDDDAAVRVIDPETGALRRRIVLGGAGEQCKWMAVDGGRLLALIGTVSPAHPNPSNYHGGDGGVTKTIRTGKLNHGSRVCAYDLATGTIAWSRDAAPDLIDPRSIAAWDGKVAFLTEDPTYVRKEIKNDAHAEIEQVDAHQMLCLDAATGKTAWRNADPFLRSLNRQYTFIFGREYVPGLVASTEGLRLRMLGIYTNDISVLDPATGAVRWNLNRGTERLDDKGKKIEVPKSYAGFFVNGEYYHDSLVFDGLSGKFLRRTAWDGGCGMRSFASGAGVFGNTVGGSVGIEAKSDCHMGTVVGGGLATVPRGWCDCASTWRGSFAFAPRGDAEVHGDIVAPNALTAGPARPRDAAADARDWPTYRRDNRRSAGSPARVAAQAVQLWHRAPRHPFAYEPEINLSVTSRQDQPTEPVAAYGLVFVGGSDGSIQALDAATGATRWSAWCGGRVYAAPTVWNGRVYLAGMDGFVHCLDAATGELAWRFQAAPRDERILIAGHLTSRWPVFSGVMVHDGVAYCAAGFAAMSGSHVYALDARTGALRWHNGETGRGSTAPESLLRPGEPGGFLTVHGSALYLKARNTIANRYRLDDGSRLPWPDIKRRPGFMRWNDNSGDVGREIMVIGDGLVATGGRNLLHELNKYTLDRGEDGFTFVPYDGDGGFQSRARVSLTGNGASLVPPAFDERGIVLVPGGYSRYAVNGKRMPDSPGPQSIQGLVMLDMPEFQRMARQEIEAAASYPDKDEKSKYFPFRMAKLTEKGVPEALAYADVPAFRWEFPGRWVGVIALALADDAVVAVRQVPGDKKAGTRMTWAVLACERATGAVRWELPLPGEPIFNGLCIDRDGRIVVSLRDGGIACYGGARP